MRYLIGALCAVALLFGAAPSVAAAATVGCGRVTTFVGPNAVGSLPSGDGWVIFAKPDGSSEKVILRGGTQVGTLSDGDLRESVCRRQPDALAGRTLEPGLPVTSADL